MIFPVAPQGPGDQTSTSPHPQDVTSARRADVTSTPAGEPLPQMHRDRLTEQGRRSHLDPMDEDAVRALAASMPLLEQAKGIVMGCYGYDAATAFAVLDHRSSSLNLKLRVLAADGGRGAVGAVGAVTAADGGAEAGLEGRAGDGRHRA